MGGTHTLRRISKRKKTMTISPNETYFFLHRQRGQLSTSRTQQRRRPRLTMATTRGLAVTNPLLPTINQSLSRNWNEIVCATPLPVNDVWVGGRSLNAVCRRPFFKFQPLFLEYIFCECCWLVYEVLHPKGHVAGGKSNYVSSCLSDK